MTPRVYEFAGAHVCHAADYLTSACHEARRLAHVIEEGGGDPIDPHFLHLPLAALAEGLEAATRCLGEAVTDHPTTAAREAAAYTAKICKDVAAYIAQSEK